MVDLFTENVFYGTGWELHIGDAIECLRSLKPHSVHCFVFSPPYWGLRDYGMKGQIGIEPTPGEFIAAMVELFREIKRVLRLDGTVWLNIGDTYSDAMTDGVPPKNKLAFLTESCLPCRRKAGISATRLSGTKRHQCHRLSRIEPRLRTNHYSC